MNTTGDDDVRALVERAVPSAGAPPMDAILDRARRRGRTRRALASSAVALVLAVVGAGVLLAWPRSELRLAGPLPVPETVLPLPAPGEVSPEFLRDGTPVFVAHESDGRVFVVEADTGRGGAVRILVGYCRSSGGYEEPLGGSRYDRAGHWSGGPSPRGLVPRGARVEGDRVRVGARGEPPARDAVSALSDGPRGDWCENRLTPADAGTGVVAHHPASRGSARTPEELASEGAAEPVLVLGTIERVANGPVRMCSGLPSGRRSLPVCESDAPVLGSPPVHWFDPSRDDEPGQVFGARGLFLMTAADGVLHVRSVLPNPYEYGGWTPGSEPGERNP